MYLSFVKSNPISFRKWVVMQTDLSLHDILKSRTLALVLLNLPMDPWSIYELN